MTLRLIQMLGTDGGRTVLASNGGTQARRVIGATTVYELAHAAIATHSTLSAVAEAFGYGELVDLNDALRRGRILAPVDHPDNARTLLTGTGLTHLGSADARDRMHAKAQSHTASDSMKMFQMGVEGGKPVHGKPGVQPEWFYKGDGSSIVGPEQPLTSPDFALNGGEEPEIAGIYVIAADGSPFRLGFTLANEFSDHVMERMNYLYLAHSKLRPASIGPELLVGELPADIHGIARIRTCRITSAIWSIIISNTRSFAGPATCTYTSLAPPRFPSPTAYWRRTGTCSKSRRNRSRCRCVIHCRPCLRRRPRSAFSRSTPSTAGHQE
jgi:hypothetical protein